MGDRQSVMGVEPVSKANRFRLGGRSVELVRVLEVRADVG